MTQSAASPTIFNGHAMCPAGTTLTGGGVDWGPTNYPGYHVVSSAPDPGSVAWNATVATGGSAVGALPSVYAICLKLS